MDAQESTSGNDHELLSRPRREDRADGRKGEISEGRNTGGSRLPRVRVNDLCSGGDRAWKTFRGDKIGRG